MGRLEGEEKRVDFTVNLTAFLAIDQHLFPPPSWTLAVAPLAVRLTPSPVKIKRTIWMVRKLS